MEDFDGTATATCLKTTNCTVKDLSHYCVSYLRMPAYEKISLIRRYTLTYAIKGYVGHRLYTFQLSTVAYGGIRWHTARQNILFKHAQKCFAYSDVWFILYDKHTLGTPDVQYSYAGISTFLSHAIIV